MSDQIYESDYVERFQFCRGLLPEYERRPRLSTYTLPKKSINKIGYLVYKVIVLLSINPRY